MSNLSFRETEDLRSSIRLPFGLTRILILFCLLACLCASPAFAQCTLNGAANACNVTGPVTVSTGYNAPAGTTTTFSGTITNNSTMLFTAGGGEDTFLNISGTVTLNGTGTLTLSTPANNTSEGSVFVQGENQNLINASDLIDGTGIIGHSNLTLSNSGTISADSSAGYGALVLNGGAVTNSFSGTGGLLSAANGGTLVINTNVNNALGNITVEDANSFVQMVDATITGGTLNNLNGGLLQTVANATLNGNVTGGLTVNGIYTATQSGGSQGATDTTTLEGTITLNGSGSKILVGAGAGYSGFVDISGAVTLNGGGTVTLNTTGAGGGNGTAIIQGENQSLSNAVGNTIDGTGIIGNGSNLTVANGGIISADSSAGYGALVLNGGAVTNSLGGTGGLLSAANGGTLVINTNVNNALGNITVEDAGSIVQVVNATITGGTLNNLNGGLLQTVANATLNGNVTGGLTVNGIYTATQSGGSQNATDTTTLEGTIALNGSGSKILVGAGAGFNGFLDISGAVTLNGGGTVTLNTTGAGGGDGTAIIQGENQNLTNAVGNTIDGTGIIGNSNLVVANGGTISADSNSGSYKELVLNGGKVTNSLNGTGGLLSAANGGTLVINTTVNNALGNITVNDGTSSVQMDGAIIQGGTLNNTAGGTMLTVGSATLDGSSQGTLTLNGIYTASQSGVSDTTTLIGTIDINGSGSKILVGGGGGFNSFLDISGTVTLAGGGTVTLNTTGAGGGNGTAIIQGENQSLINSTGNTINGTGIIGNSNLVVANGGTISANSAAGYGALVLNGGLVTNSQMGSTIFGGTLSAANGGTLVIDTNVNNANGNISVNDNSSTVQFTGNSTVTGGTLNNIHGGTMETVGTYTLSNLTLNGAYIAARGGANSDNTILSGTIADQGNIVVNGGGSGSNGTLSISGAVTLSGGGTVTLNTTGTGGGSGAAIIQGENQTLINSAGNTIQGTGIIGNSNLVLNNQGIVTANSAVGGYNALVLNGGLVTNTGTLSAANGGTLVINTTVNNAGGAISVNDGTSTVEVDGASIQGGTLNNINGGTMETVGNSTLDGGTHGALTLNGNYIAARTGASDNTTLLSSIVNQGNILVNGGSGVNGTLTIGNTVTLSGGGMVTLNTASGGGNALITGENQTLNNVNNTIQGNGSIGNGSNLVVNNEAAGTILANVSGQTLTVNSGNVSNQGTFQANTGSTLAVLSNLTNVSGGGNTITGGTYFANGGTIQINSFGNNGSGGELVNNAANLILNGTTAAITDAGGHNALFNLSNNEAAGSLTLEGGYTLQTTGAFVNAGTVTIDGTPSTLKLGAAGTGNYTQSQGTTTVNGILDAGDVIINGGTLQGTGAVNAVGAAGVKIASGSTLLPGAPGTAGAPAPGTIAITGSLAINSGGILSEGITGAAAGQFGLTNVSGAMNINGDATLDIVGSAGVQNGTTAIAVGQTLTIMTSSGLTGGFANNDITGNTTFNNGLQNWTVSSPNGKNEVLLSNAVAPITATWSGPSGNWTTNTNPAVNVGNTNWSCSLTVLGGCVPDNNHPVAGTQYLAVLNSNGNTMTLDSTSTPTSITVNSVDVQAGTLAIGTGATLTTTGNTSLDPGGNSFLTMNGGTLNVTGTLTNNAGMVGTSFGVTGFGTINAGTFNNLTTVQANGGTLDLSGSTISQISGTTLTGGGWYAGGNSAGTLKLPGDIDTINGAALYIGQSGSFVANAGGGNALAGLNLVENGVFGTANGGSFTSGGSFTVNSGSLGTAGGTLTISGLLTNENSGNVYSVGGGNILVTGNLSNDSTSMVQVQNGSQLSVQGSLTNSGSVLTGNAAGDTGGNTINVFGNVMNSGGTINLEAAGDSLAVAGSLSNTSGSTLTASGSGSVIEIGTGVGGGTLTNDSTSTVEIENGSSLSVSSGTLGQNGNVNNAGQIITGGSSGNSITVAGAFNNQTGGTFGLINSGDTASVGSLENAGTVNVNSGALLDVGTGVFTATSGYEQHSGTLTEDIGGNTAGLFGVINVGNGVQLDFSSSLTVNLVGSYDPLNGTKFDILNYGAGPVTGTFTLTDPTFNGGTQQWALSYTGGQIDLTAEAAVASSETATWSTGNNNWTTAGAFSCNPTLNPCLPNNTTGTTYAVILNSPNVGNTVQVLTLDGTSTPANITVDSVALEAGTLDIGSGASLAVNNGMPISSGATLFMTGGSLSVGGSLDNRGLIQGYGIINGGGSFTNDVGGQVYADTGTLDLSGINVTNLSGGTLTGGLWQAGVNGAATLILPGDITTNSSAIFLNLAGSGFQDSLGNDALAGLTTNNGGGLTLFDGASETIAPAGGTFTNENGSGLTSAFGGSSLSITGSVLNNTGSSINVNGNFGGASIGISGDLTNDSTSLVQVQNGGSLSIGGNVTNTGQFLTGNAAGDTGGNSVFVNGTFFNNAGGVLNLEAAGDVVQLGALNNAAGGTVTVGAGAILDDSLTNAGSITVNGTQNVNDSFTNNAGGLITVNNGGILNVKSTAGAFTNNASATVTINSGGQMNVTAPIGSYSTNTNSGTINIGGSLNFFDHMDTLGATINGGGSIALAGGSITTTSDMFLQSDNNFTGHGTISGGSLFQLEGGSITPTGTININTSAFTGDGLMTVSTGNTLALNGTFNGIGFFGNGTLNVNGGTFTDAGFLDVGESTTSGITGKMTVSNGGMATISSDLTIGFSSASVGSVTVTGANSTLNVGGNVTVGLGGTGTLTIDGGGALTNTNGGQLNVGSNGTVTISGAGPLAGGVLNTEGGDVTTYGTVDVLGGGQLNAGSGTYDQEGGTTDVSAGGSTTADNYMVNGGTFQADGAVTATGAGGVNVGANGTLIGTGTVNGTVTNGGVVAAGDYPVPGTLTVNGNYIQLSTGTLDESITGMNSFGQLLVSGDVSLAGTLDIQLAGSFTPTLGQTFLIIDPLMVTGSFTTINGSAIGSTGDYFATIYNANNVELCVEADGSSTCTAGTSPVSSVPEPGSIVLMGTCLIAIGLWMKRKNKSGNNFGSDSVR